MSAHILKDVGIYYHAYDLSGEHNQITSPFKRALLDNTRFQASGGAKSYVLGLKEASTSGSGFIDYADDATDEMLFANWGIDTGRPFTVTPEGHAAADLAYFFKTKYGTYNTGAKIGDLVAFNLEVFGDSEPVNGTILVNGALTATDTGTAYNLGAVGATQYLYAGMHVMAVSGTDTPTLTMTIQSDNVEAFSGSPETQITFTDQTAIGSEWATRVAGAITDTWWRLNYTISGTNPSFNVLVVMGIQS